MKLSSNTLKKIGIVFKLLGLIPFMILGGIIGHHEGVIDNKNIYWLIPIGIIFMLSGSFFDSYSKDKSLAFRSKFKSKPNEIKIRYFYWTLTKKSFFTIYISWIVVCSAAFLYFTINPLSNKFLLEYLPTLLYQNFSYLFILLIFLNIVEAQFFWNKFTKKQLVLNEMLRFEVEEKNREILDSIEYALRIQTAILPPTRLVKQYLEDSFILYKPKDIVAGDFYWMESVELEKERNGEIEKEGKELENWRNSELEKVVDTQHNSPNQQISNSPISDNSLILFAACDCTGHGVPGAMVSVVCHNALNRAVREFGLTQPAAILDKTAEIVIENFSKSEEDIKDGMDISLCSYNTKTKELQWAGANNPLWILKRVDNGKLTIDNDTCEQHSPLSIDNYQLLETKADKQPIGMNENSKPFTNHSFNLNTGDVIYLFTDGFADQFGGETGEKKLTRKRFKEVLLSIQHLPMQEQRNALDNFIIDFRKEVEQIDDILVMGVRV